jgi:PadR family transcriptional regulator, regulatory protein PadR
VANPVSVSGLPNQELALPKQNVVKLNDFVRLADTSKISASLIGCQESKLLPCHLSTGETVVAKPSDLVQGTVDLLILRTLAVQPMHGWGIAQRIRQVSNEVLQVNQGALYPALHRLEQQGWIRAKWGESENNRRAKYYSLTPDGAKYLRQEHAQWKRLSSAIGLVLDMS